MERKERNMTLWFMALAILPMLVMTIGRTAFSWSQNHVTDYDFLLYMCLFGITMTFFLRSLFHVHRHRNLFWKFSQGTWNFIVSMLFACVMFFGVNSEVKFVSTLHLIFTGLAIVSAYVSMLGYYNKGVRLHGAILATSVGLGGFLFMFLWPLFTTAEAEMWAAFPLMVWIFGTNKLKK